MFRKGAELEPAAVRLQGEQGGISRRSLLRLGVGTAGVAAAGVLVDMKVPGVDLLPEFPNPFNGETKEKTIDRVRQRLRKVSKYVPYEVEGLMTAQIEKDAPLFFDAIWDKKATIICPTTVQVTCDFSVFTPENGPIADDPSMLPDTSTALQPVPHIGGIPAIEVSDDRTTVTVRVPEPVIPEYQRVMMDLERTIIINGQGGLADKLQNFVNIHKVSPLALLRKAQKDAWDEANKDPYLIPKAKLQVADLIEMVLGQGFPVVNVVFMNPKAGPELPQFNQGAKSNINSQNSGK